MGSVINNFMLMGFKPNNFVQKTVSQTSSAKLLISFDINRFQLAFQNRWLLTNYVNMYIRNILRKDYTLDKLTSELYYPRNYTSRFSLSQRNKLINQFNPNKPIDSCVINETKINIFNKIGNYIANTNTQYIVVFTPINPELNNFKQGFHSSIDSFCINTKFPNVQFYNFSNLLNAEQFVDHIHPTEDGANTITKELAIILNSCSSNP